MKQSLMEQLKDFGLNPTDWILTRIAKNRVRITHKQDRDFQMLGHIDWTRATWVHLQLQSF